VVSSSLVRPSSFLLTYSSHLSGLATAPNVMVTGSPLDLILAYIDRTFFLPSSPSINEVFLSSAVVSPTRL